MTRCKTCKHAQEDHTGLQSSGGVYPEGKTGCTCQGFAPNGRLWTCSCKKYIPELSAVPPTPEVTP